MYKTKLKEMCDKNSWTFAKYSAVKDGPDHNPCFRATVSVNGAVFESPASCKSVKEAHNKVAEAALTYFISVSSTRVPNSPCSGHVISKDCSKMSDTSKSILPAGEGKVPMKKPELQNKQGGDECNTLVKNCNLKNSKCIANPLKREIIAVKHDMSSLSLNESLQDSGPKLAKGGASALKIIGKINSRKFDGSFNKGKGKLMSANSYTPAESSLDLKKPKDPEGPSFLLCNRVRVYSYVPDIAKFPKGVTLMQIGDNMWVAVSLDFPNEKAY